MPQFILNKLSVIQDSLLVILIIAAAAAAVLLVLYFVSIAKRKKEKAEKDIFAESAVNNPEDTFIPVHGKTHADNVPAEQTAVSAVKPEISPSKNPETQPYREPAQPPEFKPEIKPYIETVKPESKPEMPPVQDPVSVPETKPEPEKKEAVASVDAETKPETAVNEDLEGEGEEISAETAESVQVIESTDKANGAIEIFKDKNGKFRFRIKSANFQIIGRSEAYTTKAACVKGMKAVVKYKDTEVYDIEKDTEYKPKVGEAAFEVFKTPSGKYRFRLRSKNMQIILASQGYAAKAGCIKGIEAVKRVSENFKLIEDKEKETKNT